MAFTSGGKIELSDIPTKARGGTFYGPIQAYNVYLSRQDSAAEGGEIMLNPQNGSSIYAAMDVVYNVFRIHSNNGTRMEINLSSGAFTLPGGVGDYAEKQTATIEEPGRCVATDIDGILKPTTERLQSNCYIISDTAGLCIGKEKENVQVSVTGYVYAIPYKNKNEYHLGDCVCSAPNGTIDTMTRQEVKNFPDRIIGVVSIKPKEKQMNVNTDNRIWIKLR